MVSAARPYTCRTKGFPILFLRIIDYFLLRKYGGTKENDGSEGGKGESHDPYFSTIFHRLSVNNKLPSVFLSTYFTDNDGC